MLFFKLKHLFNARNTSPAKYAAIVCLVLLVLSWPLPGYFDLLDMTVFGIPLIYFHAIILAPLLMIFVTNHAIKILDHMDRQQVDTEND